MSGRVQKRFVAGRSTVRRDNLLSVLLSSPFTMPSCSSCEAAGFPSCQVSPKDSSQYVECVRLGRSRYDVLGPSPEQLQSLSRQHSKLERELEAAEEEALHVQAKPVRPRKQKRLWYEKMMRAVRRGIDSVEELERVEREEAA